MASELHSPRSTDRPDWLRRLDGWTLPLFACVLPFGHLPATLALVLWIASELLNSRKERWLTGSRVWFLLPVAFFFLHLLGLLYSDNLSFGLFDLQVKAGLLLVPLLMIVHGRLETTGWQRMQYALLTGLMLGLVACLVPATLTWNDTGSMHGFFYQDFSRYIHPSYFAWYADTAVLLVWLDRSGTWEKPYVRVVLLLLLSILVFLCNSKAGLAGWVFATLFGATVRTWYSRSYRPIILACCHVALFGYFVWQVVPPSENRVRAMQESLRQDSVAASDPRSTAIRMHVWESAWSLIREEPWLGYGTGDVKDRLIARYQDRGLTPAVEKKLNAHNQFLQSWVALGIVGFLLLATMLVAGAWRFRRSAVFLGFLLLTAFNFLVESMLETQSGVAFYALFYSVFLNLQSLPAKHEDRQPGGRSSPVR